MTSLTVSAEAGCQDAGILSQMGPKAKKLLITTKKHEVFVMYLGAVESVPGLCDACGSEVEMLTLDSAIKVSGINGHQMIRQIANKQIHSIETVNGHLLVCRRSVMEQELTSRSAKETPIADLR